MQTFAEFASTELNGRFRTPLSPEDESKFQEWYKYWAGKSGLNPDPDHPSQKYDYRGAYKAGFEPQVDPSDKKYHWVSQFKDDDHPSLIVDGINTKTGQPVATAPEDTRTRKTFDEFATDELKKQGQDNSRSFSDYADRTFANRAKVQTGDIGGSLLGDFVSGIIPGALKSVEKGFTKPVLEPAITTAKNLLAFPFGVGTHVGGRIRGETPEEATQVSEAWRQKIMNLGPPPSEAGIGQVINKPFEVLGGFRNRISEDVSRVTGIAKEDVGVALDAALLLSPTAKSLLKNMRPEFITTNDLVPIFKEAAEGPKADWVPAKATATIKRISAKLPKETPGAMAMRARKAGVKVPEVPPEVVKPEPVVPGKQPLVDNLKQSVDNLGNFTLPGDALKKTLETYSNEEIIGAMKWAKDQSAHVNRNVSGEAATILRERGVPVDEINWQILNVPKPEVIAPEIKAEAPVKLEGEEQLTKTEAEETGYKFVGESGRILTNPKAQKIWLLGKIDEAIGKAPEVITLGEKDFSNATARALTEKRIAAQQKSKVVFDVPGDGQFEITNTDVNLKAFRDVANKKFPITKLSAPRANLPSLARVSLDRLMTTDRPEDLGAAPVPSLSDLSRGAAKPKIEQALTPNNEFVSNGHFIVRGNQEKMTLFADRAGRNIPIEQARGQWEKLIPQATVEVSAEKIYPSARTPTVTFASADKSVRTGANATYVADIVTATGADRVMASPDPAGPIVFYRGKEPVSLLMPMKMGELSDLPMGYMNPEQLAAYRKTLAPTPAPVVESSPLKQAVDESFNKTAAEIRGAKQGGFFKITPSVTTPKIESAKVNAVLDKSVLPRRIIGRLKFKLNEKIEAFKDVFYYEHKIADQPAFQNEMRLFQATPQDACKFSGKTLVATIGKLTKDEFDTFERYIGLKSMEDEARSGRKVSGGLTAPELTGALQNLQAHITPNVQEAINNHVKFTTLAGDELIARGKLDPEMRKDFYFHHRVLDYNPPWTNNKTVPRRFQKPFRDYAQTRRGTTKALDFDYISAMSDFYEKMFLDNAIDDFHLNTMYKYDLLPEMSPNERAAAFGAPDANPKPGLIYDIKGKRYKGFQYDKGNYFYLGKTASENLIQKAIDEGWTVEEFTTSEGPRGGQALRDSLMVGRKKPVSLLPENIANRLEKFSSPTGQVPPFYFEVRNMTALWKRLTLDFAGIPFQVGNVIGDFMNGFREDPGLITKIPEAAKLSFKETYRPGKLTPEDLAALDRLNQQRISGGYMTMEANLLPGAQGALQRFKDYRNPLTWPKKGWEKFEAISAAREKVLRYAKFMKDTERIAEGKEPFTHTFKKEIAGLAPEEAAGKLNRMTFIDYDAISPQYKRYLRGRNFPFMTFYDQNMRGWAKAIARDPKNVMLKFVIPSAAVFAWNNTGDRKEIEQNLGFRRYLPHVVTGIKTSGGKDVILSLQTPFDMALSWFGLDRLPAKITDVRAGKMTIGQAAMTQLKDTVLGGPRVLWNLANPMYHLIYGIVKNQDPYTKKTVVPEKYKGTQYEKNFMAEYALGQVLSPFAAYMRLQNEIELSPDLGKFGAWLAKGPFDVLRAFGVRKIDLDVMKMSEAYEARTELSNEVKNKLAILEEAYKKANFMETTESQKYMAESFGKVMKMPGPIPSSEQIMNRLINPSVQKEIVIGMIQRTKDVETRKRLVEYLDALKKMAFVESMMKESQKAVRPFLLQELQKGLMPTLKVPEQNKQ